MGSAQAKLATELANAGVEQSRLAAATDTRGSISLGAATAISAHSPVQRHVWSKSRQIIMARCQKGQRSATIKADLTGHGALRTLGDFLDEIPLMWV